MWPDLPERPGMTKVGETPTISTEKARAARRRKPAKIQNMESSRKPVAGMLPLSQPEFEDVSQPSERMIKARIRLRSKQRHHSFRHDVNKAGYAKDLESQKQIAAGDEPFCDERG